VKRYILTIIGAVLVAGAVAALVAAAQSAPESQEESEPALEEFVPSEELPADSAISFPVDI
jgi:hypothetical protein